MLTSYTCGFYHKSMSTQKSYIHVCSLNLYRIKGPASPANQTSELNPTEDPEHPQEDALETG